MQIGEPIGILRWTLVNCDITSDCLVFDLLIIKRQRRCIEILDVGSLNEEISKERNLCNFVFVTRCAF